jgi:hypothetical protein
VGTDVFYFNSKLYLVVVDYYSRWIEAVYLAAQTLAVVVDALKDVFSRYGVPDKLRSDNGPCFNSQCFRDFAGQWGFTHATSSPHYPQSNGMAERAVGIVKTLWRKSPDHASALLAYRTTPMASGYSPGELMFGRSVRSQLGVENNDFVNYDLFEEKERESKALAADRWNEKYRAKSLGDLETGSRVWVKSPGDRGREGEVIRKDKNPESYWVKVDMRELRRNRKHLFLLGAGTENEYNDLYVEPLGNGDGRVIDSCNEPADDAVPIIVLNDVVHNCVDVPLQDEEPAQAVVQDVPNEHVVAGDDVVIVPEDTEPVVDVRVDGAEGPPLHTSESVFTDIDVIKPDIDVNVPDVDDVFYENIVQPLCTNESVIARDKVELSVTVMPDNQPLCTDESVFGGGRVNLPVAVMPNNQPLCANESVFDSNKVDLPVIDDLNLSDDQPLYTTDHKTTDSELADAGLLGTTEPKVRTKQKGPGRGVGKKSVPPSRRYTTRSGREVVNPRHKDYMYNSN